MSINFYEGKDNKPHRLFVQADRVTIHDRIVFAEAHYVVDDKCVHFYGILSSESVGIENSKDKTWRLDGQKVLLSFYKDKKPTWNNEARKFEDKEVEPSENYLYGFAKDVLKNIDSDTVSVVIAPYVNPQFLEEVKSPSVDEATISYWEAKVKNTIVAVTTDSKLLTNSDKAVLSTTSTNSGGGKTYQKSETESEKLEARWGFLKHHLGENYPINSLYELGALLAAEQSTPEGKEEKLALAKTLQLITGMWK